MIYYGYEKVKKGKLIMECTKERDAAYVRILTKELVPAMGCTEPIAIAYGAAYAKQLLPEEPLTQVDIYASGNIIKNVKSVTVPNTNGKKGIESAAAIGIVAGDAEQKLECISHVTQAQLDALDVFLKDVPIHVHHAKTSCALEVLIVLTSQTHQVEVRIKNEHSHIVYVKKDDEVFINEVCEEQTTIDPDYALLSMEGLYDFAIHTDLRDVKDILQRQIAYNTAIAQEGLDKGYGANIAKVLLSAYGDRVEVRARAMAAAGSDARMSGCELPVIINSGSGNQGMSASLPVIVYAQELQVSQEQLYRALLISNLSTLYQKQHIGRLSAYCGAVSAGAGAGAGIAYLNGGDFDAICHTIVNALAITSGIICDGAKPSCAAKIASAVDAGILGFEMYKQGKQFYRGEGIVAAGIEATIDHVGRLACKGMKDTDEEIIDLMIHA